MKSGNKYQHGQALVIIAIAFLSLIAIVGLAVDGGYAYADRRQAQNAADTSAMAAALAYSNNTSISDSSILTLVVGSTSTNGYNNSSPRSIVTVTRLNAPGECDPYVAGVHFHVDITSQVPTFFSGVVGVNSITNHVSARSLSCPPHPAPAGLGNAITALDPTACPGVTVTGNTQIFVSSTTNQGIFVNSSCNEGINSSQVALAAGGNGTVTSPSVNVVGGVYGQNIFAPTVVNTGVEPLHFGFQWPVFTSAICGNTVTATTVGGVTTFTPGVYPGTNSTWSNKRFPPNTNVIMQPGVYCFDNSFEIQANTILNGSGITIVQRAGDTVFRGGNGVNLSAPTSGIYKGLLVFFPQTNTAGKLIVNGNAALKINGSLVAPWSTVELNGGGSVSAPLETQVIADTLKFAGSNNLYLTYNAENQYQVSVPGALELFR